MSLGSDYLADTVGDDYLYRVKLEKEAADQVWTTKDGRKLKVSDMSDDHIRNTLKYIKKNDTQDYMIGWVNTFENELKRREQQKNDQNSYKQKLDKMLQNENKNIEKENEDYAAYNG